MVQDLVAILDLTTLGWCQLEDIHTLTNKVYQLGTGRGGHAQKAEPIRGAFH